MTDPIGMSALAAPLMATQPVGKAKDDPVKIAEAAKEFEALLLGQMLKSVREADSSGWLGSGEDGASDCAMAIAEEQFAHVLSANGGLGLSSLVISGLRKGR
jgi:peptidoglycan hydrolase FlgJ